jgi:AbrB family looped-hinge helix DNA binding protein
VFQVKLSSRFQITIPKENRERLQMRPGQKITLFEKEGVIKAIPDPPFEKLRGIAKGMSTAGIREKQDRF